MCIFMNFVHRTLNNNNITALPREIFSGMPRIRALRLSDNPFTCDCHLSWLSRYLRNSPRLAPYTRCHSPSQLKGQSLAELHEHDFKCSGKLKFVYRIFNYPRPSSKLMQFIAYKSADWQSDQVNEPHRYIKKNRSFHSCGQMKGQLIVNQFQSIVMWIWLCSFSSRSISGRLCVE